MQCFLCHAEGMTKFLDLGMQPLANKYPTQEQIAGEDFFPIHMYFCPTCKNVQMGTTVDRSRMFEDYYYLSSVNQGLVRHFEALAKKLAGPVRGQPHAAAEHEVQASNGAGAKFVVDIGSNDGVLLKPLKELGVKAVGIEPSINVSKIANNAGLETITAFFNEDSVKETIAKYGKSDAIVASSVFTHLEDPHQCIEDVKKLITDDGAFIIEVEYIGNMLEKIQFERFYLDRIFYYSLTSLKHLFESHGMYIADVEHIEPHGGSLQVTARLAGRGEPTARVAGLLAIEEKALTPAKLEEFRANVESNITAFKAKLEEYKKAGLKVAGYGAPARVATITNYGDIGPDLVEFIVDDSPLKQGRFSPGKHIPIVTNAYLADHEPDVLVVFAYEYFDDIKKKVHGTYRYLIPIPPREVI